MNSIQRTLCLATLTLAALAAGRAEAGRIGGPMADSGTLAAGQSVNLYVPFSAGEAAVSVINQTPGNVQLFLHDGDGNVAEAEYERGRGLAVVEVNRPGFLRVEVRNTGSAPVRLILGTN